MISGCFIRSARDIGLVRSVSVLRRIWARLRRGHGLLPPPASPCERWGGLGWGGVPRVGTDLLYSKCPPPPSPPHHSLGEWGEGRSPLRGLGIPTGAVVAASFLVSLAAPAFAQTPPTTQPRVTIGYVDIAGDPRHEPIRAYERLILKTRE